MFFKELETDRLFLKNISSDDREFIFTVFSNDDVKKYLFRGMEYPHKIYTKFINGNHNKVK